MRKGGTGTPLPAQPWQGREVTWRIDGEPFTAHYNPGEIAVMEIAKGRGASRADLEALHLIKALLDGTIVSAEAS